jgi:hypothetical protein
MDLLTLLWNFLILVLGLAWQLVWFLLRDLISALLWILIAAWLVLSVRYRSFTAGALTVLRYGGYGLRLIWSWLRGSPAPGRRVAGERALRRSKAARRAPLGTMSISTQLNILIVGGFYLLIFV